MYGTCLAYYLFAPILGTYEECELIEDRFCRNAVGPPEWEHEAMGSVVWVQCANLYRVCVKSIDSLVLDHGHSSY